MEAADKLNEITQGIIGAAITVHRELGPGLLESAYEACLAFELSDKGFRVEQQKPVPLKYREITLDCGYRLDILVEGAVVVEVKSVGALAPIRKAQLLSYLRLADLRLGLLMNFNVLTLKDGIQRVVNNLPEPQRSPRTPR